MSLSLDAQALRLLLDRIYDGAITVRLDEVGFDSYQEDGRPCWFATYLFRALVEQGYATWDSMIEGPGARLIVRNDGIRAVRLEDKGYEARKRLCEQQSGQQ